MKSSTLIIVGVILCVFESAFATQFRFANVTPRQREEMRLLLDMASARLSKLLDVTLPDTIDVAVVQTEQQFDSLAGGRLPEWGAGAAIPGRNLMLLREPMMDQYPGSMANLLQHELAHIALHERTHGAYIPRFIDEGFASWFAGEWTFSNVTTIAAAQLTKSLLPLREIDDVNAFHQAQANLAYSQSYLVVLYIYQRFGELAFLDLLDAFAKGKELNESFRTSLGISFWSFEYDYRRFLSEKYTLFSILSDAMGLWIVLAVVVIAGYILLRRRKKGVISRWKEEEKYASTDFDYSGSDDEPWKDSEDSSARP